MYNPLDALQRMCDDLGDPGVQAQSGQIPSGRVQSGDVKEIQVVLRRKEGKVSFNEIWPINFILKRRKEISPDIVFLIAQK